jgi:hypothetical protein
MIRHHRTERQEKQQWFNLLNGFLRPDTARSFARPQRGWLETA